MRPTRRVAAIVVVLLVAALAACAPALPPSVVAGSSVVVAWEGAFTSVNAAAAPTAGNLDIAAATRGRFGDVVDGEFIADESFGTVTIAADDPFTVRYDLAEPSWSDGIPLDAADLLLGWAAGAGYFGGARVDAGADASADGGAAAGEDGANAGGDVAAGAEAAVGAAVPTLDEFARAIDVTYAQPSITWQTAVDVAVPAHVVGERAFSLDDPMEAKQAVIRAIVDDDQTAIGELAAVWNDAFEIGGETDIPADLLLSSGPYRIDAVERVASEGAGDGAGEDAGAGDSAGGSATQRVRLVPNAAYRGAAAPQIAQVDLVPPGVDPIAQIGGDLDIAQAVPTPGNHAAVHDLEREDFVVQTTHDGTVWGVRLDATGVFTDPAARAAFLRAVPADAMVTAGGGEWAQAYGKTTSVLAAPESPAYEIVAEDSGFTTTLGTPADEPALDRDAAGVAAGTSVCVLYDRASAFAAGAFAAMRDLMAEDGWTIADCGSDDVTASLAQAGWDAVIDRVPLSLTPTQLAEQWGSAGSASAWSLPDADRDALIAQYAQTVDVYDARELLAQIEASIVRAAVVRPLAVDPVVTVVDRDVTGVTVRNGPVAPLLSGIAAWAPVP